MIGRTILHYKIISELGAGGMGVVYKAEDTKLGRTVALKFLPPELTTDDAAKKRLLHEARAISHLQHQNICTIHEIGETDDGHLFICMDYYEGETLKDRLTRGPLSLEEAIDVTTQIARGLEAAHKRGIVHRDIKPANVVVTKDGVAKILDFGLAKLTGQTKVTKTGSTVGTIAYMSPEQVRGEDLDARSDIFSLGVTFYELLTGATPFAADHDPAVMHKILNVAPPSIRSSGVKHAAQLEPIIGKMLAKEPPERYQMANEVISSISRLSVKEPREITRPSVGRWIVASIAAVALVLAVVFGVRWNRNHGGTTRVAEPRLAILYFENLTDPDDPERLGEIATNLLITDLSESKYVNVVSSQRLYDILKRLGKEGVKVVDRDTATRVAREAGATEMLTGSIMRSGGNVELTGQLVNVTSGESRATQSIRGAGDENIFSLVDRLSAEIKNDLELPRGATREHDVAVADVTTHSTEAYRYYLEGRDLSNQYRLPEARASYEKAVAVDSTFAMAWIELVQWGMLEWGGVTPAEQKTALAKAVAHSSNASRKEARYIAVWADVFADDKARASAKLEELIREYPDDKRFCYDINFMFWDPNVRITYLNKVIAIDPMDKLAYNELAYCYQAIGDTERSTWAVNQYLHLAPEDASAYDTRGDLYALNGQIRQAIEAFRRCVEVDSKWGPGWYNLGLLYLATGDEAKARECWALALRLDPASRVWARYSLALIPMYHGHGGEALEAMEEAVAADQRDGYDGPLLRRKHLYVGYLLARKGDWQGAEAAFRRAEDGNQSTFLRSRRIAYLAEVDVSRVEGRLAALRTLDGAGERYAIARSWVEMAHGRYDLATDVIDSVRVSYHPLLTNFTRGVAYLRSGRWRASVEKLEYCRDAFDVQDDFPPNVCVPVHYYLGQAYEGNGESAKAIKEYEAFIAMWHDADAMFIGQVNDARQRLKRLRG